MNKTAKTISILHGTTFSLFALVNVAFNYYIYPILTKKISSGFFIVLLDALMSAFLYSVLYLIVSNSYKLIFFKIRNKSQNLNGIWYHVHIKRNMHGLVKSNHVRAGVTKVKQNFYDLDFTADNYSISLAPDGELVENTCATKQTHWRYCAADWNDNSIIACYTASSTNKKKIAQCPFCGVMMSEREISGEYKDRVGVHRLTIINKDYIRGTFADQYPSASYGEIFFFRDKADRDKLIKQFLRGDDINR